MNLQTPLEITETLQKLVLDVQQAGVGEPKTFGMTLVMHFFDQALQRDDIPHIELIPVLAGYVVESMRLIQALANRRPWFITTLDKYVNEVPFFYTVMSYSPSMPLNVVSLF